MGGGRSKLLPQSAGGSRQDGNNLATLWQEDKASNGSNASYVISRDELLAIDVNKTDYLMGELNSKLKMLTILKSSFSFECENVVYHES